MNEPPKRSYKKGKEFTHKLTRKKIIFGKWNEDGTAACITTDNIFLNLKREELDNDYISHSELDRKAREKRKGQCW